MPARGGILIWTMLALLAGGSMVFGAPAGGGSKAADLTSLVEAQMKWREKVEAENRRLREGVDALQSENAVLAQSLKKISQQHQAATNALRYLQINDYLMENRASIISSLQKEWLPRKDPLFAALWKQGRALQFEVSDVFLYQTNVVARADFLWSNPDGSGGVGRANIWMDPMRDFEITGSNIQEQMRISAQELAAISGEPQKAVVMEKLAEREKARPSDEGAEQAKPNPFLSERTKERLTDAGIAVATTVAIKAFASWIDSQVKNR